MSAFTDLREKQPLPVRLPDMGVTPMLGMV